MTNQFIRKYHILILIAITFLLLAFSVLHIFGIVAHNYLIEVPLHSSIEALGGTMFILIAILIFVRYYDDTAEVDYPLIGMGFLSMGIFDLYHSFQLPGNNFVLSHILSQLNGGFWMALLVLSPKNKARIKNKTVAFISIFTWFVLLLALSFGADLFPMLNDDGTFTALSFILNSLAGVGFLAGSIVLLIRYRRNFENEIFLIAVIILIQALSSITFHWSEIWDIEWWLWHIYRFATSLILFYSVFIVFRKMNTGLKKVNQSQQTILDAMPFGLMVIGKDKKIIQINKAAQQLTGFSEEKTKGQFCYDTVCNSNCNICPVLNLKEEMEEKEVEIKKLDGTSFHALKTVKPIVLNNEEVLLEGFVDISKIVEAELELKDTLLNLERSNTELEQFAYVSSHDLQEPLRKIKNYSDLIVVNNRERLDKKGQKHLDIISRGATRMQKMIDDLLGISRITSQDEKRTRIDLKKLILQVRNSLKDEYLETELNITVHALPNITGPEKQLYTLFYQLISNAIKFKSTATPKIEISSEDKETEWLIAIKDNGIGLDMKYAEKIFVIFQRLHARDKFEGTGIGLAMCKKIVEKLGGEIWVESEPDKGATFYFTLPKVNEKQ